MRRMTRTGLGAVAISAMSLLGSGRVAAQDADLQAQVEGFQQTFEEAVAAGDWQTIGSAFAETATYMPLTGGMVEDREEIQSVYEQSGLKTLDIRSSKTEMVAENLILDIGTFTATFAGEAGDMEVEGEYVLLGEVGENGAQIRSLTAFPARQPPGAPAEQ